MARGKLSKSRGKLSKRRGKANTIMRRNIKNRSKKNKKRYTLVAFF